jgi:predicted SAM-dependent methyltransferase
MIKEAFRCLKRNGVIRLVVPDLYKLCKKYISEYEANSNISSSEQLLWALNLHREGQYGMNIPWFKKLVFEWQGYPHQHKYMYDFKSLYQLLHEQGFSAIQEKQYAQSDYISQILDVEGTVESYISVYLEARKC